MNVSGGDGALTPGRDAVLLARWAQERAAEDFLALSLDGMEDRLVGDQALNGAEVRSLATYWIVEAIGGRRLSVTVVRRAIRVLAEGVEARRGDADRPPPELYPDDNASRVLALCLAVADRLERKQ